MMMKFPMKDIVENIFVIRNSKRVEVVPILDAYKAYIDKLDFLPYYQHRVFFVHDVVDASDAGITPQEWYEKVCTINDVIEHPPIGSDYERLKTIYDEWNVEYTIERLHPSRIFSLTLDIELDPFITPTVQHQFDKNGAFVKLVK